MQIETFTVGMLQTNCYVASDPQSREAIIIDPGLDFSGEAQPIIEYIEHSKLKVKYIVNTHGHDDHTKGNRLLQQKYGVPLCIHGLDAVFLEDNASGNVMLQDGSEIKFGAETLTVFHTPGHTPGSICLLNGEVMFSGDTLFAFSIGRTDFAEGSPRDMKRSLQKIKQLPDNLVVYPGHGEATVLGEEKRVNPFLVDGNSYF
jgi:hydroxyacylglutathione hydrolase